MSLAYLLAPFLAYLAAGSLKFIINSIRLKKPAFKAMGLGGFPSTHNTVTATVASLIACKEGLSSPALSVALALVLIVALDSMGLRKAVEAQARMLVRLHPADAQRQKIREKIGHSKLEALAGLALGSFCGFLLASLGI